MWKKTRGGFKSDTDMRGGEAKHKHAETPKKEERPTATDYLQLIFATSATNSTLRFAT